MLNDIMVSVRIRAAAREMLGEAKEKLAKAYEHGGVSGEYLVQLKQKVQDCETFYRRVCSICMTHGIPDEK